MTARERILAELEGEPDGLTKSELIKRLDLGRGHARSLFNTMQVRGEITVEKVRREGSVSHVCKLVEASGAAA